ncbi:MAG: hypothetical protein RIC83_00850 [Alphaproteobacteria bacterium]
MRNKKTFPCTLIKACNVLYYVRICGYSLTEAAIRAELNVGTVCHIVHRRRFPMAEPIPPAHFA